jgi:hypothetical protein
MKSSSYGIKFMPFVLLFSGALSYYGSILREAESKQEAIPTQLTADATSLTHQVMAIARNYDGDPSDFSEQDQQTLMDRAGITADSSLYVPGLTELYAVHPKVRLDAELGKRVSAVIDFGYIDLTHNHGSHWSKLLYAEDLPKLQFPLESK